jgi:hypothetical protein
MKPSLHLTLLSMALASTVGCSGGSTGGNFLGGNDYPSGNIVLSDPQTGAAFTTSATHPYPVNGNAFSVGITETHFGGPYSVTPYSYDSGFNEPCYEPHLIDGVDATNIVQFRPDNAAPIPAPGQPTQVNPCNPDQNDQEVWLINDGKGHELFFYYQLPANPVPSTDARRK